MISSDKRYFDFSVCVEYVRIVYSLLLAGIIHIFHTPQDIEEIVNVRSTGLEGESTPGLSDKIL